MVSDWADVMAATPHSPAMAVVDEEKKKPAGDVPWLGVSAMKEESKNWVSFSASLTQLVGCQEGHPACKKNLRH